MLLSSYLFIPDRPYWKGGWIRVNAAECGQQDILESVRQGNFYATQGPEFKENTVTVETSAVTFVRLIGPSRTGKWIHALGKEAICRAEFDLPCDWPDARPGKEPGPIRYGFQIISPFHSFSKKSFQGKMVMLSCVILSYRSQLTAAKF